jgi:GT2 family glycosyltransferase
MQPSISIVIPTRERPGYLEVALRSVAPQASEAKAQILVIDDSTGSPGTRAIAERFGARYERHRGPLGLNVARNTGVDRSQGELVVFLDDDIQVKEGWLDALVDAVGAHPEIEVFTGPITARIEGKAPRSCGREGPPITSLELGSQDTEAPYAWGANMAVRRHALNRVGPFEVSLVNGGDEQEWQDRWRAGGGGPVMYVARAGLYHRRTGPDGRLAALARAARSRGKASRRFDAWRGQAPSLAQETRTLAGCAGHVIRRRCPAALVMVAHSAGRLQQGLHERLGADRSAGRGAGRGAAAGNGVATGSSQPADGRPTEAEDAREDFLSGESGSVGGIDRARRVALDVLVDGLQIATRRRWALARAAALLPARRRVLVLVVTRPEHTMLVRAIEQELEHSRHEVQLHMADAGQLGKFENLNKMLAKHRMSAYDWLLLIDDDVKLPSGFLDQFLFLAERFSLDLAQPAHRARSHAAWRVTRRRTSSVARETRFVEIGPVTAFARSTHPTLLPFPELRMGWGLDAHWAALAAEHGWRCGVIDAVAILHAAAPAGTAYSRREALSEAQTFLAERPYLSALESQRTLLAHRHW